MRSRPACQRALFMEDTSARVEFYGKRIGDQIILHRVALTRLEVSTRTYFPSPLADIPHEISELCFSPPRLATGVTLIWDFETTSISKQADWFEAFVRAEVDRSTT